MSTRNILALVITVGVIALLIIAAVSLLSPATAGTRENCFIQGRLKVLRYFDGEIDCKIGPESVEAIRAFQAAKGLPETGYAGPRTMRALVGSTSGEVPTADDYQPEDLKGNPR